MILTKIVHHENKSQIKDQIQPWPMPNSMMKELKLKIQKYTPNVKQIYLELEGETYKPISKDEAEKPSEGTIKLDRPVTEEWMIESRGNLQDLL